MRVRPQVSVGGDVGVSEYHELPSRFLAGRVEMPDAFTSSEWMVPSGEPAAFLDAFQAFLQSGAAFTEGMEGSIYRDAEDPRRFIAVCHWMDEAGLLRWHGSAEYDEGIEIVYSKGGVLSRDGVLMHKSAHLRWPENGDAPGGGRVPG
jgi:hypothetical protein